MLGAIWPQGATAEAESHCAYRLEPVAVKGTTTLATLVDLGCYDTFAEALSTGSDGKIVVETYCPAWKGQRYDAWGFLHFDLAITSKTNLRLLGTREKHRPLNGFDGEPSFAGRAFVRLPLEGPITVEQTW